MLPGHVTPHGATDETILAGYYRLWLTHEKLLTGNDSADAALVYFRANAAEVTTQVTAQAFAAGLLPAASVNMNVYRRPTIRFSIRYPRVSPCSIRRKPSRP